MTGAVAVPATVQAVFPTRISPAADPATAVPSPASATDVSELVVGDVSACQVAPESALVRIMPVSPTATACVPRTTTSLTVAGGRSPT